jgi:hypothetical protein
VADFVGVAAFCVLVLAAVGVRFRRRTAAAVPLSRALSKGVPEELRIALACQEGALETWQTLDTADQAALAVFVCSSSLGAVRRRRARVVAKRCAIGRESIAEWMAHNHAISAVGFPGPFG